MEGQNEKLHVHKQEKSYWLTKRDIYNSGADPGGALKLEKILFFWRKIVTFHTKYPKYFRASLPPLGAFFLSAPPP